MSSTGSTLTSGVARAVKTNDEHEIIRALVSHDSTVNPNHEDFLSESKVCGDKIPGNQCLNLLDRCINGANTACAQEWAGLPWENGIDWENMDHGAASRLYKNLDLGSGVDKVSRDLATAASTTGSPSATLSSSLQMALQAIYNKVNPQEAKRPSAPTGTSGVHPRVSVVQRFGGGFQTGGGNSYANFVRSMDALKVNLSMNGGGQYTAAMVRANLRELQAQLHKLNKSIQPDDLARINDAIDSLERSEKRVGKAREYINILTQAIRDERIVKGNTILNTEAGNTASLKVLQQLAESEKQSKAAATRKAYNIYDLLYSIKESLDRMEKAKTTA